MAENAFLNAGICAAPLVPWYLERTRLHAVATSDALTLIVQDGTFRCFLESTHRANGGTRGINAMLAHSPNEYAIMFFQGCVGCGRERLFFPGGQLVGRLAGVLAGIAADTER